MFCTTALFNQYVDINSRIFNQFKKILLGGKALNVHYISKFFDQNKDFAVEIFNVYGPTENTTFSTIKKTTPIDLNTTNIPIGLPISGTRCYVLDELGHLQPVDVAGELHVSGLGVALGYLNKDTLTKE